jgi:hypothetical protein
VFENPLIKHFVLSQVSLPKKPDVLADLSNSQTNPIAYKIGNPNFQLFYTSAAF